MLEQGMSLHQPIPAPKRCVIPPALPHHKEAAMRLLADKPGKYERTVILANYIACHEFAEEERRKRLSAESEVKRLKARLQEAQEAGMNV
jgi:hypothetical protein